MNFWDESREEVLGRDLGDVWAYVDEHGALIISVSKALRQILLDEAKTNHPGVRKVALVLLADRETR